MIFDLEFVLSALRIATPLMIVALGVLIAERAGVLFLGAEGVMLCGALFGILGAVYVGDPGSPVSAVEGNPNLCCVNAWI